MDEIVRPGAETGASGRSFEFREEWYPVSVSLSSPFPTGTVHPDPRIAANPGFCADCGVLGKTAYRLRAAVKSGGIRRIGEKTRDKLGFISRKVLSFGEPGTLVGGPHMPKSEKRYPFSGSPPKLCTFRRGAWRLYAREFLYICLLYTSGEIEAQVPEGLPHREVGDEHAGDDHRQRGVHAREEAEGVEQEPGQADLQKVEQNAERRAERAGRKQDLLPTDPAVPPQEQDVYKRQESG